MNEISYKPSVDELCELSEREDKRTKRNAYTKRQPKYFYFTHPRITNEILLVHNLRRNIQTKYYPKHTKNHTKNSCVWYYYIRDKKPYDETLSYLSIWFGFFDIAKHDHPKDNEARNKYHLVLFDETPWI